MNKAILVGNLARDPELKTTQSGISVVTFTIACNRRFVNQQGVREADFITCVAWRQTAEFIARYFTKGSSIGVDGTIQTRSYDAQDGTKRYVTEVVVDNAEFVGKRGEQGRSREDIPLPPEPPAFAGQSGSQPMGDQSFSGGAAQGSAKGFTEVDDDELPF